MTVASVRPLHAAGSDPHTGLRGSDRHVLWCADCGRVVPCSMDDIVRFSDAGWPHCCDEVMSLDSDVTPGD
jgi:hypothetical protein